MTLNLHLDRLREMHPLLAQVTALELAHKAAVGLDRHTHVSGASLKLWLDSNSRSATLHWTHSPKQDGVQLDFHRVTEDAAEAIALAVVNAAHGWVVRRRLQRREFADWLLSDRDGNGVCLEVSGVDKVDVAQRRLALKIAQVKKSQSAGSRAACVVELQPPRCRMNKV